MTALAMAMAAARRAGGSGRAAACWWAAAPGAHPLLQQVVAPAAAASCASSCTVLTGARTRWTGPWLAAAQQHHEQQRQQLNWSWQHEQHAQQQRQHCQVPLCLRWYSTDLKSTASNDASKEQQQQQQQPERKHGAVQQPAPPKGMAALQAAGWSRREVVNVPNILSLLRLLSGPVIASWILDAQWSLALPALAVSGASDWADGWAARRFNQHSVIGSYLDPLADKVLICCVVGALGWSGVLPGPVVGIIVGRDVLLVTGAFAARAKALGWRWPGAAEFFRVGSGRSSSGSTGGPMTAAAGKASAAEAAPAAGAGVEDSAGSGGGGGSGPSRAPAAPPAQPLYISKVNTVFQLSLVGTCILHSWLGWPGEDAVWVGSALTAGTTLWSCIAYLRAYQQGRVFAPTGASSRAAAAADAGADGALRR